MIWTQEDHGQLASAVESLRRERGWSMEEASRRAGISSITWKRVEDGLPVQDAKLGAIERALGWLKPSRADVVAPVGRGSPDLSGVTLQDMFAEIARRIAD